jgi:hypothetical protein
VKETLVVTGGAYRNALGNILWSLSLLVAGRKRETKRKERREKEDEQGKTAV